MRTPHDVTVAVLGLGAMGSRVAQRLLNAGFRLQVWNRTPQDLDGATVAQTPAQAAANASVVLVCVRDDDASREVWAALTPALSDTAIAIELSTVTPQRARELAATLGRRFIEAPMVGSRPQVEAGQLQLLLNGDPEVIATVQPVLDAASGGVHVVEGAPGSAAVVKLAVNGLLAVQLAAAGELMRASASAGVAPESLAAILTSLPVTSPALARSLPRGLIGDTAPNFPLELVGKDLGYLLDLAQDAKVLRATRTVVADAVGAGYGGEDIVALISG